MSERCSAYCAKPYENHQCTRNASVRRGKRAYCAQHDPLKNLDTKKSDKKVKSARSGDALELAVKAVESCGGRVIWGAD